MKIHLAALWRALRRSSAQDAGLAALLLTGTWAVNGAAATPVISTSFAETIWLRDPPGRWFLIGVCVAAVAPLGDLFESLVKRDLGVKDAGRLFGEHGGVLDRLDAAFFSIVVAYYAASALL